MAITGKKSAKKKKCVKATAFPCKNTCLPRRQPSGKLTNCRNPLKGQAATAVQWVADQEARLIETNKKRTRAGLSEARLENGYIVADKPVKKAIAAPSKPAHELTLDEFINQERQALIDRRPGLKDFYSDEAVKMAFDANARQAQDKWVKALKDKAESGRISDRAIDSFVDKFGQAELNRTFRGTTEKGIQGWIPKDVRDETPKPTEKTKTKKSISNLIKEESTKKGLVEKESDRPKITTTATLSNPKDDINKGILLGNQFITEDVGDRYGDGTNAGRYVEYRVRKMPYEEVSKYTGSNYQGQFALERRYYDDSTTGRYWEGEWSPTEFGRTEKDLLEKQKNLLSGLDKSNHSFVNKAKQESQQAKEAERQQRERDRAEAKIKEANHKDWMENHVNKQYANSLSGKKTTLSLDLRGDNDERSTADVPATVYGNLAVHKKYYYTDNNGKVHLHPNYSISDPSTGIVVVPSVPTLEQARKLSAVLYHEISDKAPIEWSAEERRKAGNIVSAFLGGDRPSHITDNSTPVIRESQKGKSRKVSDRGSQPNAGEQLKYNDLTKLRHNALLQITKSRSPKAAKEKYEKIQAELAELEKQFPGIKHTITQTDREKAQWAKTESDGLKALADYQGKQSGSTPTTKAVTDAKKAVKEAEKAVNEAKTSAISRKVNPDIDQAVARAEGKLYDATNNLEREQAKQSGIELKKLASDLAITRKEFIDRWMKEAIYKNDLTPSKQSISGKWEDQIDKAFKQGKTIPQELIDSMTPQHRKYFDILKEKQNKKVSDTPQKVSTTQKDKPIYDRAKDELLAGIPNLLDMNISDGLKKIDEFMKTKGISTPSASFNPWTWFQTAKHVQGSPTKTEASDRVPSKSLTKNQVTPISKNDLEDIKKGDTLYFKKGTSYFPGEVDFVNTNFGDVTLKVSSDSGGVTIKTISARKGEIFTSKTQPIAKGTKSFDNALSAIESVIGDSKPIREIVKGLLDGSAKSTIASIVGTSPQDVKAVEQQILKQMGATVTASSSLWNQFSDDEVRALAKEAIAKNYTPPSNPKPEQNPIIDKMNDILSEYGWNIKDGKLYNSKGTEVHQIEIKGGRIKLLNDKGELRGSLYSPDGIGQYIEKTFYADKKAPESKPDLAGQGDLFNPPKPKDTPLSVKSEPMSPRDKAIAERIKQEQQRSKNGKGFTDTTKAYIAESLLAQKGSFAEAVKPISFNGFKITGLPIDLINQAAKMIKDGDGYNANKLFKKETTYKSRPDYATVTARNKAIDLLKNAGFLQGDRGSYYLTDEGSKFFENYTPPKTSTDIGQEFISINIPGATQFNIKNTPEAIAAFMKGAGIKPEDLQKWADKLKTLSFSERRSITRFETLKLMALARYVNHYHKTA